MSARLVLATTFLNPKGLVFAVAIIPRESPLLPAYLAVFAIIVVALGCTWFLVGRSLRSIAGARAAALPRVGATVLFAFAAYVAATIAG